MAKIEGTTRPDLDVKGKVTVDDGPVGDSYTVHVKVRGRALLLCHRYDCEAVEAKAAAAKGSQEKKTDNIESYLYRDDDGNCGIPGYAIKATLAHAAKSLKDPRSPRKSAFDLFRAATLVEQTVVPIIGQDGKPKQTWDLLDKRPVLVQQVRVPRVRPGFQPGWTAEFDVTVIDANYLTPEMLRDALDRSGKYVGLLDNRPECGRFDVVHFERVKLY